MVSQAVGHTTLNCAHRESTMYAFFSIFLGTNDATIRVYTKGWQTIVHRPRVVFPHGHALAGNDWARLQIHGPSIMPCGVSSNLDPVDLTTL